MVSLKQNKHDPTDIQNFLAYSNFILKQVQQLN